MHKNILLRICFVGMLVFLPAEFVTAQNIQFSTNLGRGSSGKEVAYLQEFLKTILDLYPEGMITGYFGALTERAVKRFQSKYGIEPVGNVGKKTRAKLNSLYFPQSSRPQKGVVKTVPKQNSAQKQQITASLARQFADLEKELLDAKAKGSYLAPEHSTRIQNDLTRWENQNYDAAEIKRLRAIVLVLSPHLQEQSKLNTLQNQTGSTQLSPPSTSVSSPAPTGSAAENKPSGKPLVIKNLGVSFEQLDKNTNRAGAFLFLPSEQKVFLEYGVEVPSATGGTKILPTFEYRTAKDAEVFAASDGVITKIAYQAQTQDYEILIQPEIGSQWTLGHDHVSAVKVSEGDTVKAGDVLGTAGTLGGALGRTEIMIWGSSSQNSPLTYCPFKLFVPELLSEYQQKVSRHMKEWEEFKGNADLYAEEKHLFAGCLQETIFD